MLRTGLHITLLAELSLDDILRVASLVWILSCFYFPLVAVIL
ncbi:20600_t:CDS:1, partial [Dentiscutata erythropus]